MRCPKCDQWNRASLPRCMRCGTELNANGSLAPTWRAQMMERGQAKEYIRVDEDGDIAVTPDDREVLAAEMTELKARKDAGMQRQQQLREAAETRQAYMDGPLPLRTLQDDAAPAFDGMATYDEADAYGETAVYGGAQEDAPAYDAAQDGIDPDGTVADSAPSAPVDEAAADASPVQMVGADRPASQMPPMVSRRRVRVNRAALEDDAPADAAAVQPRPSQTQNVPAARAGQTVRTVQSDPRLWQDSRTYDPMVDDMQLNNVFKQPVQLNKLPDTPSRRMGLRRAIRVVTTVLILGVLCLAGYIGLSTWQKYKDTTAEKNRAIVTASIMDDLAAHTILIPGEEGQSIYIKELHSSYTVTGGFATLEIADHTWYTDMEAITDDTMTVTLTPYVRTTSGRQKPLDLIEYEISIPLSPIQLVTPESLRTEVTTAMYSMLFNVRPDSIVYINGENVSDTVSEEGTLTYNATVQPIGDNVYNISVRSPYCRDNSMQIVLYREVQEIPLDLAATTYTSTSLSVLPITATTLPGADIDILSPHSDLKITDLDTTGSFTFNAIFDKIGYNTISIEASYPGKKTSHVDYTIYYLPNPDVYTPKAWPLNRASDYAELLSNITYRAEHTQVYVAVGKIDHLVSESPQMAVVYCSDDGLSQPVLLENQTKTVWEVGEYYNIYADAYGTYNGMPWLIARYTYK